MKTAFSAISATLMFAFAMSPVQAANLIVQVSDNAGAAVLDAVAYAEPASGQVIGKPTRANQIEQRGRKFAPQVSVVQTGSSISFPNNDTVRHHVYSFSPAKVFELKLYSGTGTEPIIFDKAGTVVVGCNIHDQMAAWIQVVDTPWFAKTDASGKAVLDNLPAGKYRVKIWHRALAAGVAIPEQLISIGGADVTVAVGLPFKTDKKQD
jgi:plastocyanin